MAPSVTPTADFERILERAFIAEDPFERFSQLKAELEARLQGLKELQEEGMSGRRVVKRMTRIVDELLAALYNDAAGRHLDVPPPVRTPGLALVAVGGYGRQELNPHSDIDLLFLFAPGRDKEVKGITNEVLYPLWDLKLTVGHSVRTIADCVEMGLDDLSARTAMMESRLLAGDKALYESYVNEFTAKVTKKDIQAFLFQKSEECRSRHERFGATVFLQQPNVKESAGGLRDIHYLIWTAIPRYGTGKLGELHKLGVLSEQDYKTMVRAKGFLWRIRNEMHMAAGKRVDTLTFEEQLRISEKLGFTDTATARGVERFMRRYYTYASRILDISGRFAEKAIDRPLGRTLGGMLFSRKIAPYFTLTNWEIRVNPSRGQEFLADGAGILNLFHLAQSYGLTIHPDTTDLLSGARIPGRRLRTRKATEIFMDMLGWDSGIAETLHRMHRLRILVRLMPELARVDRLVTFSQYHKYTVDAHTLHAVEIMEDLNGVDDIFGDVYRKLKRKQVLYLALLLHDAGKGSGRDHCEVGEELCHSVAKRMHLSEKDANMLVFLVRNHLLMSHVGFRRDLSDDRVLSEFVRKIETPERLKMLFVLTHVDIRAVGPETWNAWKEGLLIELYDRALEMLAGRRVVQKKDEVAAKVRRALNERFKPEHRAWLAETLELLPGRYLITNSIDDLYLHLNMVRKLREQVVQVEIIPHEGGQAEVVVCAHDNKVPGLFSRIAGTLSAKDLTIHDARITTFRDDVILDVFRVEDPNMGNLIDHARWDRISKALLDTLEGRVAVGSLFTGTHGKPSYEGVPFSGTEPLVRVDNNSSESFTVIDVFAADRQGLLYQLTQAIAELNLSIYFSRIATKADQVVDVFYVKNEQGGKVTDADHVEHIRERLMAVISRGLKP